MVGRFRYHYILLCNHSHRCYSLCKHCVTASKCSFFAAAFQFVVEKEDRSIDNGNGKTNIRLDRFACASFRSKARRFSRTSSHVSSKMERDMEPMPRYTWMSSYFYGTENEQKKLMLFTVMTAIIRRHPSNVADVASACCKSISRTQSSLDTLKRMGLLKSETADCVTLKMDEGSYTWNHLPRESDRLYNYYDNYMNDVATYDQIREGIERRKQAAVRERNARVEQIRRERAVATSNATIEQTIVECEQSATSASTIAATPLTTIAPDMGSQDVVDACAFYRQRFEDMNGLRKTIAYSAPHFEALKLLFPDEHEQVETLKTSLLEERKTQLGNQLVDFVSQMESETGIETRVVTRVCPICLHAVSEPHALIKCGHLVCAECRRVASNDVASNDVASSDTEMICPICRKKGATVKLYL